MAITQQQLRQCIVSAWHHLTRQLTTKQLLLLCCLRSALVDMNHEMQNKRAIGAELLMQSAA